MEAQGKALFRAKLRESAQKREKQRIDSPLVRYNENDQPVCRVCNVALKSDTLWQAHQASRKHHEAIENLRATAAGLNRGKNTMPEPPAELQKAHLPSTLPADFCDSQEPAKKQKKEMGGRHVTQTADKLVRSDPALPSHRSEEVPESGNKTDELLNAQLAEKNEDGDNESSTIISQHLRKPGASNVKQIRGVLPENFFDCNGREKLRISSDADPLLSKPVNRAPPNGFFETRERSETYDSNQATISSNRVGGVESKQVIGVLPEGFFDNKDADLRARGIQPVKVDMDDAYKEFEKEIQGDLQEVDDRLEEEEIDAAEVREEFESLEQQSYREQMEIVKKKVLEVKSTRIAKLQKSPAAMGKESSDESSSDGDDDEENFTVDWRAQHL